MEEERTQNYEKIGYELEKLLKEKELGPELEEVFKYYLEVLFGDEISKKYYISKSAFELVNKVKEFPNRVNVNKSR